MRLIRRRKLLWVAYAVDNGPVKRCRPGDPVPSEWFEAAVNPSWTAVAHNDAFETAIEQHILHPRYGFPIIPPERHRCTQAAALALGLPAKLGLLADVLELTDRKDSTGERLMHLMSKPRKAAKGEDPKGTYWHEDERHATARLLLQWSTLKSSARRMVDCRQLSDAEQAVWVLSNAINARGFHVDRVFAEAARKITKAAGPEINDKITAITAGAVTTIHQVDKSVPCSQHHPSRRREGELQPRLPWQVSLGAGGSKHPAGQAHLQENGRHTILCWHPPERARRHPLWDGCRQADPHTGSQVSGDFGNQGGHLPAYSARVASSPKGHEPSKSQGSKRPESRVVA